MKNLQIYSEETEAKMKASALFFPKENFLQSVSISYVMRVENELWEKKEKNPSGDLTRLSDGARGLPINIT